MQCLREGNGNPLQYSFLENPMDRGAWQAVVLRVVQSQTWLKQLSTHAPLFYHLEWTHKLHWQSILKKKNFFFKALHQTQDLLVHFLKNNFYYLLTIVCSIWDLCSPNQRSNPCSLQWKSGVLTTGLPQKFLARFLMVQLIDKPLSSKRVYWKAT